jgi:hypothetical protein
VGGKPLAQAMQDRLFGPLRLQHTELPASTVNTIPDPYSHGYLYGSASVAMVGTSPYSPQVQSAARAGTLLPKDYTGLNHSFAAAAGGVISTANDLATWIQALVGGRVLNAAYQRRWLDSLRPEDPSKPDGQQYGYGIAKRQGGPNTMYFHGGETPGYNSFMGYDPRQSGDTRGLDESDRIAQRTSDSQRPHVESARSDLRSVAATTSPSLQTRKVTRPHGAQCAIIQSQYVARAKKPSVCECSRHP